MGAPVPTALRKGTKLAPRQAAAGLLGLCPLQALGEVAILTVRPRPGVHGGTREAPPERSVGIPGVSGGLPEAPGT